MIYQGQSALWYPSKAASLILLFLFAFQTQKAIPAITRTPPTTMMAIAQPARVYLQQIPSPQQLHPEGQANALDVPPLQQTAPPERHAPPM